MCGKYKRHSLATIRLSKPINGKRMGGRKES
jgi:hypothetical protein